MAAFSASVRLGVLLLGAVLVGYSIEAWGAPVARMILAAITTARLEATTATPVRLCSAFLRAHQAKDPHRLDGNGGGEVCEGLP